MLLISPAFPAVFLFFAGLFVVIRAAGPVWFFFSPRDPAASGQLKKTELGFIVGLNLNAGSSFVVATTRSMQLVFTAC